MNIHVDRPDRHDDDGAAIHQDVRGESPNEGHGIDDDLYAHKRVKRLIAVTSLTSPSLVLASGALCAGLPGLAVAAPLAGALYVGLVLNDNLVIREATAGRSVMASMILRAMVPITGTALTSIPVFMTLFGADIDRAIADRQQRQVEPVRAQVSRQVDADIDFVRAQLAAASAERTQIRADRKALLAPILADEERNRGALAAAEATISQMNLVLACEADGSRCNSSSSGQAGDKGPVSNLARHRLEDATQAQRAATAHLHDDDARSQTLTEEADRRLAMLEGPPAISNSISGLQKQFDERTAARDRLVRERVEGDPVVKAAMTPAGFGERLITLMTVILGQPALLMLTLIAKAFLTVFELLGLSRGLGFAKDSYDGWIRQQEGHRRLLDRNAWSNKRRLAQKLARIDTARALWEARRSFADARSFDRSNGLRSFLSRSKTRRWR